MTTKRRACGTVQCVPSANQNTQQGCWKKRWLYVCRSLTCCAPSPLTMWGRSGTSPFRMGGGAKSSGIWSVIIIVTYIHGELDWTALSGKIQKQKTTSSVCINKLFACSFWFYYIQKAGRVCCCFLVQSLGLIIKFRSLWITGINWWLGKYRSGLPC